MVSIILKTVFHRFFGGIFVLCLVCDGYFCISVVSYLATSPSLNSPEEKDYFVGDLENITKKFLKEYGHSIEQYKNNDKETIVNEIINDNITSEEICRAIDSLRTNRSAGIDGIPAESIKAWGPSQ